MARRLFKRGTITTLLLLLLCVGLLEFIYINAKSEDTLTSALKIPSRFCEGIENQDEIEIQPDSGSRSFYRTKKWREILLHSLDSRKIVNYENLRSDSYPLKLDMLALVESYKDDSESVTKQAINVYPYSFIEMPGKLPCDEIYLLFLIRSKMSNFERRQAIRETWTNAKYFKQFQISRVFLLGTNSDTIQSKYGDRFQKEIDAFGDILQMNFLDVPSNYTWKARGGIKWVVDECSRAKYVMLVNDDYYVATDLLIQMLDTFNKSNKAYIGWITEHQIQRRKKYKHLKQEFPYNTNPAYIKSECVVLSMDFVIDFNVASQYIRHFSNEDMFLAIVANKLKVVPSDCALFYPRKTSYTQSDFWRVLVSRDYQHDELRKAWNCHLHWLHNYRLQ